MKPWILLKKSINIGGKEIIYEDIESVSLLSKGGLFSNGRIFIKVNGNSVRLGFSAKQQKEGLEAFEILHKNMGGVKTPLKHRNDYVIPSDDKSYPRSTVDIIAEINSIHPFSFMKEAEVGELVKILRKDEHIMAIISSYQNIMGIEGVCKCLSICTNERVLVINNVLKRLFVYDLQVTEIPFDSIDNICYSIGLASVGDDGNGSIGLITRLCERWFSIIPNNLVKIFVDEAVKGMNSVRLNKKEPIQFINDFSITDEIFKFNNLDK